MPIDRPIRVAFFRLDSGGEPVRDWLKDLPKEQRKAIGEDVKTLQFGVAHRNAAGPKDD